MGSVVAAQRLCSLVSGVLVHGLSYIAQQKKKKNHHNLLVVEMMEIRERERGDNGADLSKFTNW